MKVYVTIYALTKGILVREGWKSATNDNVFFVAGPYGGFINYYGSEWHVEESAAIARAEEMRTKKIASLEKQIAKLRALTIKITG